MTVENLLDFPIIFVIIILNKGIINSNPSDGQIMCVGFSGT